MTVIAEGIETSDQLAQLLVLGCGFGQGFLFARPTEPDEIERLLADRAPGAPAGRGTGDGQSAAPASSRGAGPSQPMIMQVAEPWASSLPLAASVSRACAVAWRRPR